MFEGNLPVQSLAEPIGWMPAMEIIEKDDALVVTAELPGVDIKDVAIAGVLALWVL